jgi:hypothetical protein
VDFTARFDVEIDDYAEVPNEGDTIAWELQDFVCNRSYVI